MERHSMSKCPVPHDQRENHPMLASFRGGEQRGDEPNAAPSSADSTVRSPPGGKPPGGNSSAPGEEPLKAGKAAISGGNDGGARPSMCPVPHEQRATHPLFRPAAIGSTADGAGDAGGGGGSVGAFADVKPLDPSTSANMMHAPNQRPAPGQKWALPTERQRSSIPRGDFVPGHQEDKTAQELAKGGGGGENGEDKRNWVYPSEQMFFNAMNRKGWGPNEEDMPVVIKIHNAVNERTWMEVLKWEAMHSECKEPKLYKFMGRPKDLSPKARVNQMMGYKKPFDRHDWVVDRCGEHVRYIIDFYEGNVDRTRDGRQGFFLDTRPALDSPGALVDRLKMWWHKL